MITNFLCLTAPWVAGSSPLPSRHIRDSGWLEVWRCPFDCRMRHEVLNLQSIYLLKMYRNPFTHFLIASEAHVKCRCCAILAILPFMTYLIARDEARSAKLVTQMCNSAFYIPIWLPGWGTKCQISSGYTFFIHFFLIFSWVFPPFWSLSCLLLVGRNVITFYFLSYILF